ncbi:MAG: glycosyltransferase family 39 protein [Patescibacteria group bacterium]|jgi:hypothetical protein
MKKITDHIKKNPFTFRATFQKIAVDVTPTWIRKKVQWLEKRISIKLVLCLAVILAIAATTLSLSKDWIIVYGDSESHLNIAKRVIHSITPGFAQLGGIWLPLPHLLMVPFVMIEPLYRTGLAGSIVSGIAYVISAVYLYKLTYSITNSKISAFIAFVVFATNPNALYMQSTPMTELPLTAFFLLSSYYFIRFISSGSISSMMLAGLFGFCATLSRYDGWFLVAFEALIIVLVHFWNEGTFSLVFKRRIDQILETFQKAQGKLVLFSTVAFFGIIIWMAWDFLILGDPFYFTNSQFSARAQQENWFRRGELPAKGDLPLAFVYFLVTSMSSGGILLSLVALIGMYLYITSTEKKKWFVVLVLLVPFIFNVFTLFVGQSVIFIPHVTPRSFEWTLFNVRYGMLMLPVIALFFGYLYHKGKTLVRALLILLIVMQFALYTVGYSQAISLQDGLVGLSSAKRPDAETWMRKNYDHGLVLLDDYARSISIIRAGIPMQNIIYVGNKPYWEISLKKPSAYARWIVMQRDDSVWKAIIDDKHMSDQLYTYFQKVYTSKEVLIFRRIPGK